MKKKNDFIHACIYVHLRDDFLVAQSALEYFDRQFYSTIFIHDILYTGAAKTIETFLKDIIGIKRYKQIHVYQLKRINGNNELHPL